ncbi:MAG: galactokinase [Leptospiraceae bacterium]|nr:galactokinase [Leptospiraceae bacterium]MDW8305694.1 galactokinase [Leptospiraceae bacterium]
MREAALNDLEEIFENLYGRPRRFIFFSPGRVNLIGDHIDYNGGNVLPAALSKGIYALLAPREDNKLILNSLSLPGQLEVDLNKLEHKEESYTWANYIRGVGYFLQKRGVSLKGADVLIASTLPAAAGLSSSAALEVLAARFFLYLAGREMDPIEIALMCQQVENQYVGVNCGIMDQFSVTMGKKDHAILLNTQNLSYRYIPVSLGDYQFLILHTGKKRELAHSQYNQRRQECEEALEKLKKRQGIQNLVEAEIDDARKVLGESVLFRRVRHVVSENQRVFAFARSLERGEVSELGRLMNESHLSLKNDYEVTGVELDTLQKLCVSHTGCVGCRMTGAGFGGAVVALVKKAERDVFSQEVMAEYMKIIANKPSVYDVEISDGASLLNEI